MFTFCFFAVLIALGIYSYGFVDLNLHLTDNPLFLAFQKPLSDLVYHNMTLAGIMYVLLIAALYAWYVKAMTMNNLPWKKIIVVGAVILLFSFPAFTYDIFNYMTTASVAYTHRENPYIVMPIEIPNEPGLAYTRAANKIALYGPTWLLLTWIPHTLGGGMLWQTIISFKLLIATFYILMLLLIYRITKNIKQVLFFALNPLVLIEVLLSGHNDIVMMVLALLSLGVGLTAKNNWLTVVAWVASVGVKGATVVLFPLIFLTSLDAKKVYIVSFWLMFAVFVLFAPIREELYPWYAIWFLTFAAVIPITKRSFIHGFTIALCIGLSFRHLPYILTREYGGAGPTLRMVFTLVPSMSYVFWYIKKYGLNKT